MNEYLWVISSMNTQVMRIRLIQKYKKRWKEKEAAWCGSVGKHDSKMDVDRPPTLSPVAIV